MGIYGLNVYFLGPRKFFSVKVVSDFC